MTDEEADQKAQQEVLDCIAFYHSNGCTWIVAVSYICFTHMFGSWYELVKKIRRPYSSECAAQRRSSLL